MKHLNFFKRALLALLILCSSSVWAYEFEVDGIYYNITDETSRAVEVTSGENKYTGSVVIPSAVTYNSVAYSVTSIGDEAFYWCTRLTSVTIPNSVTSIGDKAFYFCLLLTSIEIPNSVTSIGDSAFFNCRSLTSVTIGNGVTSIGDDVFSNCNNLTSIVIDENNNVYDSREGCNAIIETATNTLVQGFKNTAIPNSVTSIGDYAFYNCTGLTSIEIPNSVTSIGDSAFYDCDGLTNVTIGNSVRSIGRMAFYGCSGLTSIVIPNSVTSIGYSAFRFCNGLTGITIGNSVRGIGDLAFQNCTGLTNIEIPASVTSIGNNAFSACDGLTSIVVDEENSVYDSREGCNAIIRTSTNTLIQGCMNTIIPNSVTRIESDAFCWCDGLTEITIPNSVTTIASSAFLDCTGLTSVTIGNSVTEIGWSAFNNCSNLTEITIPNSVTSIGGLAFYKCIGLTSVTIGNSVTSIGYEAFFLCDALTDIYFASNPTIGDDDAIPSTATCHLTITDSDAADFNIANANTYDDVSYTRTISEGKYGTIMLPFAPDEASLENYAFYTLKEAGDGYIRFEEVAAPEANTPYLYTLRAGGENAAITGGQTTIAADINNCNVDGWELVGSFSNQTIDCTGGNYYALSPAENKINRITKTLTVLPYRAYFKSTVAQNSNLRVFIGGTTGVTEISPDDIEGFDGGAVYDLYGRPVSEPAKGGIYIIDGKKVVW